MANGNGAVPAYIIRDAEERDLPDMIEIYNEQIATSTAIFKDDPFEYDERRKWMHDTKAAGFPIFVARSGNDVQSGSIGDAKSDPSVLGFAYYSTFRPRTGYRYTAELTLYVHKSIRGGGVGSSLMKTLLTHAQEDGKIHALIATITADNVGSIRFHERFGFVETGTMKEVGYKFGRWQDVTFMQLLLPGGPSMVN